MSLCGEKGGWLVVGRERMRWGKKQRTPCSYMNHDDIVAKRMIDGPQPVWWKC